MMKIVSRNEHGRQRLSNLIIKHYQLINYLDDLSVAYKLMDHSVESLIVDRRVTEYVPYDYISFAVYNNEKNVILDFTFYLQQNGIDFKFKIKNSGIIKKVVQELKNYDFKWFKNSYSKKRCEFTFQIEKNIPDTIKKIIQIFESHSLL